MKTTGIENLRKISSAFDFYDAYYAYTLGSLPDDKRRELEPLLQEVFYDENAHCSIRFKRPFSEFNSDGLRHDMEHLSAIGLNVLFLPLEYMSDYVDKVTFDGINSGDVGFIASVIESNRKGDGMSDDELSSALNATSLGNLAYIILNCKDELCVKSCEALLNRVYSVVWGGSDKGVSCDFEGSPDSFSPEMLYAISPDVGKRAAHRIKVKNTSNKDVSCVFEGGSVIFRRDFDLEKIPLEGFFSGTLFGDSDSPIFAEVDAGLLDCDGFGLIRIQSNPAFDSVGISDIVDEKISMIQGLSGNLSEAFALLIKENAELRSVRNSFAAFRDMLIILSFENGSASKEYNVMDYISPYQYQSNIVDVPLSLEDKKSKWQSVSFDVKAGTDVIIVFF
jgi:hypothetical protein